MTKPTKWHVRPAKTLISLDIRSVWSESPLCAWRKLGSLATHWAHSEDSDQTGRMPRVIWVSLGAQVILLVLTWGGSDSVKALMRLRGCYTLFAYLRVYCIYDNCNRNCFHEIKTSRMIIKVEKSNKELNKSLQWVLSFASSCENWSIFQVELVSYAKC